MLGFVKAAMLLMIALSGIAAFGQASKVAMPGVENYREWVYLTSGFDMSYAALMDMSGHHAFDNVFVNPAAHEVCVKTGHWPV